MSTNKKEATPAGLDFLERLFRRRDQERERIEKSTKVVDGEKLPWEINRMGKCKWYMHPDKMDTAIRDFVFWMQEIPPGSHSGKQKHQGGRLHYIFEGKGYTEIDDKKYEWEKGDMILLPIKVNGVVFQHFNSDAKNSATLVCVEPNVYDALGVDLGAGFEQLENAPQYEPHTRGKKMT